MLVVKEDRILCMFTRNRSKAGFDRSTSVQHMVTNFVNCNFTSLRRFLGND